MDKWISVKDDVPQKEGYYRFKIDGVPAKENGHWNEKDLYNPKYGWLYNWYTVVSTKVTHWKPNK